MRTDDSALGYGIEGNAMTLVCQQLMGLFLLVTTTQTRGKLFNEKKTVQEENLFKKKSRKQLNGEKAAR